MTASVSQGPSSIFALLDDAPMSARRYFYWLLASGGTFLDGFAVVVLGIAVPLLRRDFDMGPVIVGLLGSALVLGAVAGAALGGIAADRIGRRPVFLLDMAVIASGSALCAIAPNAVLLVAGQFVLGVGVGIDFPTSGSYVSEILPQKIRSRMTVATISLQSVGMIFAALAAIGILRLHPSTGDWRLLLASPGALALCFLLLRFALPESPRWLVRKGRLDEALAVVAALSGVRPNAAGAVGASVLQPSSNRAPAPAARGIGLLFSKEYRTRTLLVSVPWLLMDVATYGVGLFTPVILGAMHLSSSGAGPVAKVLADAEGSVAVDLFLLFGFLAALWAVPRFGRIAMQVAGFAGMALGMLVLMLAALAADGPEMHIALVIGGFVLFNFAMNAGPNATTFTLAPHLFPTEIRASASGFAAASAKVGATLGTFLAPQLQAAFGLVGVLALMTLVSCCGLVATAGLARAMRREDAMEETAPDTVMS